MDIDVFTTHPAQLAIKDRLGGNRVLNRVVTVFTSLKAARTRAAAELGAPRGRFGWMPESMWQRHSALLQARLELERLR